MEKLGFEKVAKRIMIKYTFVDEKIENQVYELDKNMFEEIVKKNHQTFTNIFLDNCNKSS